MGKEFREDTPCQVPYALSLLVCDSVITEAATNKVTIVGAFSSISASNFPAMHFRMCLFAEVTDGKGDIPMTFQIVDVDEETTVFKGDGVLKVSNPLVIGRLVIQLGPLVFPAPGEYRVQLIADGEHLIERRLLLIQEGGEGDEPDERDA
jgi:hypothetical protein